ncbi:MAG TPA: sigma-70 family RNA polymerase sigma factor [Candidatus Paceibacterota bacterium]|nr:sigma-70 family RNA polymerase sigma factor [Candidatus Paceibacterota bacterium]
MTMDFGFIMTNQDDAIGEGIRDADASDEKIAVLAVADDRYFEILMERYEEKLRRYVMRFINCSVHDAQDIVQETFIDAYRNLNGFNADLKFSSWIYRIAHNEAVSHVRHGAARPTVAMEDEKLETLASEINVEGELEKKMDDAKLREAINRLDAKYKEVIVLRYFEEKSYEEISDILRKPAGSVSSLVVRAKRLLLKEIGKNGVPL